MIVTIRDNEYPLLFAAKRVGVAYWKDLRKRMVGLLSAALPVAFLSLGDRVWAVRVLAIFLVMHLVYQTYVGAYRVRYYPDHSLTALVVGAAFQAGLYWALVYFPFFYWEPVSFFVDTGILLGTAAVVAGMVSMVGVVFQPPFNRQSDRLSLCPKCGVVVEVVKRRKRVMQDTSEMAESPRPSEAFGAWRHATVTRCWNCDFYKEAIY